jgi:hypothetical protein
MRTGTLFRNLRSPPEPQSNGKHGFMGRKVMMMTMMIMMMMTAAAIIQFYSLFIYVLSSAASVQLQST